ncbi:MAG: hypothetical protein KGI98_14605 [Euryarchaeota archaeon]|nr:hypothetical protein [Euryarchaeota archaeon]MDE1881176.1 hypothetical protein [Euryarchaeota archaeon]
MISAPLAPPARARLPRIQVLRAVDQDGRAWVHVPGWSARPRRLWVWRIESAVSWAFLGLLVAWMLSAIAPWMPDTARQGGALLSLYALVWSGFQVWTAVHERRRGLAVDAAARADREGAAPPVTSVTRGGRTWRAVPIGAAAREVPATRDGPEDRGAPPSETDVPRLWDPSCCSSRSPGHPTRFPQPE